MKHLMGLFFVLTLVTCSHIELDTDYDPTRTVFERIKIKCAETADNEPLAKKECGPLFEKRKFLVQLQSVRNEEKKLMLHAYAGGRENDLTCEAGPELAKSIRNNPAQIKIGEKYWMSGDFVRYRGWNLTAYIELEKCQIQPYQ